MSHVCSLEGAKRATSMVHVLISCRVISYQSRLASVAYVNASGRSADPTPRQDNTAYDIHDVIIVHSLLLLLVLVLSLLLCHDHDTHYFTVIIHYKLSLYALLSYIMDTFIIIIIIIMFWIVSCYIVSKP